VAVGTARNLNVEKEGPGSINVAGHLWGALAQVEGVKFRLAEVRSALFNAEEAARRVGRPYEDLRALGDEIDTLKGLLDEKVGDVLQRIAMEETKSLG
jgi:hypothetical protein